MEKDVGEKKKIMKANEEKRLHYPAAAAAAEIHVGKEIKKINLEIIKSRLIPNLQFK